MAAKLNVLVIGGSGNTGFPVTTSLLEEGGFNIYLLCRHESQEKSRITELKSKGAIIRVGDLAHDSVEALEKALLGIDILLSMVDGTATNFQKKIFQAALKNKDIKRVIPSEFGIFSPPGVAVTTMRDNQMEVRSFIQEIGLPYTYINVGWWMDLILPYPCSADENNMLTQRSRITVGSGNVKTAVTSNSDIGKFISRIIRDPRTLNAHVFCYGDEVTLEEVYNTAEKVSKEDLRSKSIHVNGYSFSIPLLFAYPLPLRLKIPEEQLRMRLQEARENYRHSPNRVTLGFQTGYECLDAMYIRGLNTIEMAKEFGALDARLLYPDFKPASLEEYAEQFYKQLPDIHVPEAIRNHSHNLTAS